jgi:hypothetical protein
MENLIKFDDVNTKIITVRNQNVILDSDVALLYGVETMRINEAVKNNPDKFPEGYIVRLTKKEWSNLKSKFLTSSLEMSENEKETSLRSKNLILDNSNSLRSKISILDKQGRGQHKKYLPNVFTEKGLYMLATILKSPQATETTIAIVETFAKLKELQSNLAILNSMDSEVIEPEIIETTGGLLDEMLFSGHLKSAKTSLELNLGVMKLKREVTSENPDISKDIYSRIEHLERKIEKMSQKSETF